MSQQRPELKSIESYQDDYIEEWVPTFEEEVHLRLTLGFGPASSEGADLYNVRVVTPQSINRLNLGKKIADVRGRGFLVVSPYSWSGIIAEIEKVLSLCVGDSYREASKPLDEHFDWEGDY